MTDDATLGQELATAFADGGMDPARAARCGAAVEGVIVLVREASGDDVELALALVMNAAMVIVDCAENKGEVLEALITQLAKERYGDEVVEPPPDDDHLP